MTRRQPTLGLSEAVTAFVSDLAHLPGGSGDDGTGQRADAGGPAEEGDTEVSREVSGEVSREVWREVWREAWRIAAGFVACDGICTDTELGALISVFGDRLGGALAETSPSELRAGGFLDGADAWLTRPSPMLERLAARDAEDGTAVANRRTGIYHDRAVAIGFAVAALDPYTTEAELATIEAFRSVLARAGAPGGQGPGVPDRGSVSPDTAARSAGVRASPAGPSPADDRAPAKPLEDLLAELDRLIGLDEVKAEIRLVCDLIQVQNLRRDRGLPVPDASRHLIFAGNPGTGKTTVARLLAEIYRSLGVLSRGQLVETDRAALVAGYLGQTATRVTEAFDAADGGLLLIDEAYALARGGERDFGREAIDTLVKLTEDRRDRLVVVAAGYPDEMGTFVAANPGLASRFPRTIHFADYDDDELVAILERLAEDAGYHLTPAARDAARSRFAAQPRERGFGNGRAARNLFEATLARHASRVVGIEDPSDEDLSRLTATDVSRAAGDGRGRPARGAGGAGDP